MEATLYHWIRTDALSASLTAQTSPAAPAGAQGCYVLADGGLVHIDMTGATATTNSGPIPSLQGHYVRASEGQTFSYIRGSAAASDVPLYLTWVKE